MLLTLTISGLTLHAQLFIEIQLNGFALVKNADPIIKFFNRLKHFILFCILA